MGLFKRLKRQLLEVVEWKDSSKNTIVYRFPLTERDELMNSSTLVVRESQCAVFVHKGEIADVFGPGTYKLSTENIPFLTKLLSLPTGFNSRIKAEIYFVNTKQFTGNKWGTQNPIMLRDSELGMLRLRGFGVYSFKVEDVKTFMKEMFGTNEIYTVEDASNQLKPMLIQSISDAIAESKIQALDLAANYKEFSSEVVKIANEEFNHFGLKLCSMVIENISLPEEVEKMLDERTKLGVLDGKMGSYTQLKAADAIGDAAKNPNGNNLAGLGVGLGAGAGIGQMFTNNLNFKDEDLKVKDEKKIAKVPCVKCGAEISKRAKFCPECGATQGKVCPKCNETNSANAKFCTNCGESLIQKSVCHKCGKEIKKGAKFCPECGEKL